VRPKINLGGLRKPKTWEYVVRFLFGGLVTVCSGLVAHAYGPTLGGLFLAFPSILPASLTLVKQHEGRAKALEDARGARLGSVGLAAFAIVIWAGGTSLKPALLLVAATGAWLFVSVGLWLVQYGSRAR